MKLYFRAFKMLFEKYILQKNTGIVIKEFCEKMGVVYIKLAQILSTQNRDNYFTEEDRQQLSTICDSCNPIPFSDIKVILEEEYGDNLDKLFLKIDPVPIGSASISQVHKAILMNGEEVVLKIKRKDITNNIERDIEQIRKLMNKYGPIFKFSNLIGGNQALNLYLKMIQEETDFENEVNNIKKYHKFKDEVNGQVEGVKKIIIPKLYEDLCTKNVIVMEYIKYPTLNNIELTEENKKIIFNGISSYLRLSFYAVFNGKQVVFHGDPHVGNIFFDKDGNIGFLDMGLLFALSPEDTELVKNFFFAAYTGNYEKLFKLLSKYGTWTEDKKLSFKEDLKKFCEEVSEKDVTYYFTDMIKICLNYEFLPPDFLYYMAKPFVCLNGINVVSDTMISCKSLLEQQIIEYYIRKNLEDSISIIMNSLKLSPQLIKNVERYGLTQGISYTASNNVESLKELKKVLENYSDLLDMFKGYCCPKCKTKVKN